MLKNRKKLIIFALRKQNRDMASKHRILTRNNNTQRRKLKLSLLEKKREILFYFNCPLDITISTEGLTQEQIDLLKALETKGLLPKITWISSSPNGFDDVMKCALLHLHSDKAKEMGCKILRGYDYAWIKIALERGPIPDRYSSHRYMSTPKFVDYIRRLGFKDIVGSKTLNKYIAQAKWHSEGNSLTFPICFIGNTECKRRNHIVVKFLEIMNEV